MGSIKRWTRGVDRGGRSKWSLVILGELAFGGKILLGYIYLGGFARGKETFF